jgi:hypothetical protein
MLLSTRTLSSGRLDGIAFINALEAGSNVFQVIRRFR